MAIDESSFTGETEPSLKTTDVISTTDIQHLSQRRNIAFMGTLVKSGYGKGVVICIGEHSQFGEIFKMMQEEEVCFLKIFVMK